MLYKQGTPKSVIDAAIAKENLAMAKSNKGDFVASNSIDDPSAKAEPARGKGAAYDQEKQEMAAREAAMTAAAERTERPRTGVAGPEMPTFKTPSISPAEKAKQAADLAAKIKANTPVPARPTPVKRPTSPAPAQPVAVAQKAINAVPKLNIAPQNTNPAPNVNAAANAASKFGSALKQMRLKSGGNVSKPSSASKRGDGIAQRGKTKGRML